MPLQHGSNNIIMEERFPVQEQPTAAAAAMTTTATTACGGGKTVNSNSNISSADNDNNNNGSSGDKKDNGKVNASSNGVTGKLKRVKRIIKVKKVVRRVVLGEKKGVGLDKAVKGAGGSGSKEVAVLEKKESGLKTEEKSKEVAAEKKESGLKKEDKSKEVAAERKESGLKSSSGSKIVENGDGLGSGDSKVQSGSNNIKEEVEEGELGTLRWPSKGEIENGEFVPTPEKPRRSEIERGEIGSGKWKKGDIEKGEIVSGNKWRKGEAVRDEIEKGEFIPDRWNIKDEYGYNKSRGRHDMSSERTPPSGKYSSEDVYRRKELSRSGGMRWESGQERSTRISSKIVDEEGSYKSEYSNGKSHEREHASGNRLKRHVTDSDNTERKYYGDYAISKSRRLSEDGSRYAYSEHYSRHSVERFYKSSSYSRVSSSDKYSSRHHEPTLSSKVVYDRHSHSDRSPHDRPRYYDHRDRSPIRYEKSPYGREKTPFAHERSPYGRERSPYGRERSPYWRDRSPDGHDRSPYGREKSPYGRERSPYVLEKSPYDRSSYNEHRKRSPAYFERSPQDRTRHHDRSDKTPSYLERSPHDRARPTNHREASRKGAAHEKRSSQYGNKKQDDKISQKDPAVKDTELSAKESQDKSSVHNLDGLDEKNASSETRLEEKSESPVINAKESPKVDGPPPEELQSMEEDMDICDTPPHVPVVADTSTGRWFYLDHFGVECGPSKLCELKALVDEGILMSDHFIKHLDSDRWLTIENAVSPLVTVNFPSVVPDVITQLVSPPEAPGNLLADTGDIVQSCSQIGEGVPGNLLQPLVCPNHSAVASEPLEDLQIDERVGALLEGFSVVPGSEIETVGGFLFLFFNFLSFTFHFLELNNVLVI